MVARLVLEWALPPRVLADLASETRGETQAISEDPDIVESLRDVAVPVIHAEPSDPSVLDGMERPDVIIAAADEATENYNAMTAAKEVFPDATRVAYVSGGTEPTVHRQLAKIADRTVDADEALRLRLLDRVNTPAAVRYHRVRAILHSVDGQLAIVTHDTPDPDAIASAVALEHVAERLGVPATTYYYGEITHQSNRALINSLDLSLNRLDEDEDLPPRGAIALVDHANPGVNNSLPADTPIDLIFDHHTPGGPVNARFVDLRESVGATSTIMTEYLRQSDIRIHASLASALVYGIRTDTRDFERNASVLDFEAAAYLWPRADHQALEQVENPSVSPETLGTIAQAIDQRRIEGPVLSACVGTINERDALGQAADLLLQMDGVAVTMVYGIIEDEVIASARARTHDVPFDLAAVMRDAFAQIGSAGGHEQMAGARIPLGILAEGDEESSADRVAVIREVVDARFIETIRDSVPPDHR